MNRADASIADGANQPPPSRPDGPDPASLTAARRRELVRLAYRLCWNEADAEDAVQDALLLARDRRDQLARAEKRWAWLRAIVVRRCRELMRRAVRRRRVESLPRARDQRGDPADAAVQQRERTAALRGALLRLPERQRTAVALRHLEEMSYAEIAGIMSISESTVRVLVRNGREGLRRLLDAEGPAQ